MKTGSTLLLLVALICCGNAKAQDRRAELLDESKWPAFVQDRPLKAGDGDSRLTKLSKERYNAALVELRNRYIYWLQNHGTLSDVCENAHRVVTSRIDIDLPAVDRVQMLKEKMEFAEAISRQADARFQSGRNTTNAADQYFARYYRADAELELERAKMEPPKDVDKKAAR